jgi:predicted RNase H-like HicB family nuclease
LNLKVIIHKAEEDGYWAEVPAIPGCFTQGDTWDELTQNLYEAIEGCLEVNSLPVIVASQKRILISLSTTTSNTGWRREQGGRLGNKI